MRPSGLPMRHLRSLTVVTVLAVAFASILIVSPPAAATQNRPTWTQGDFWVYTRTQGSATSTIRVEVHERSTLTFALGSYSVWHITTTTTPSGGSATVQDSWVQDSNLGTAQTNITFLGSTITVKYDPPLAEAVFPLAVNAQWSLSTTVRFSNSTFTLPFAYGATVIAENTTTVAAGSFSVAVIQRTSSGGGHDRDHYSEGAGNHVRRESYDANGNRVSDQQLTSYRYQSSTLGLLLIGIGIAVVAVIAIAVLVTLRRRRARGPPQAPPPVPPPPP